ncbi:MAG: DsbA family protein [Alphaproteobacteria bacterium]|nr:DsbA family protein [Alphaproteobacteria bacterium]
MSEKKTTSVIRNNKNDTVVVQRKTTKPQQDNQKIKTETINNVASNISNTNNLQQANDLIKIISVFIFGCLIGSIVIYFVLLNKINSTTTPSDNYYNFHDVSEQEKPSHKKHEQEIKEKEQIKREIRAEIEREIAESQHPKPTPKTNGRPNEEIVAQILERKTVYSLGNPNGSYIIVKFFDYNCGWCKRTSQAFQKAFKEGTIPNVRLVLIDTPIFGESSAIISRFVMASKKQGKLTQMHEEVINASGKLDKSKLLQIAKKLGMDIHQLESDANSMEIRNQLTENKKLSEELKIIGVPYLIVNGKSNPGALIGEKFEQMVIESNQ